MTKTEIFGAAVALWGCGIGLSIAQPAAPPSQPPSLSPQVVEFFESKVRPVLAEHWFRCHGPEKQKRGLRLDSREAMLKGSESGPVIVPGQPDKSLLVEAITQKGDLKMPPDEKLP